ncbi:MULTISPECIES: twin-arginine translocase TatA/TatE family subunit [Nocardioides]|uniref:Twin-arginine translocase TatA/TatE family subunit n=1 Tax=Nocardioides vastitatis TaxID=2568655 RepID=A0ABW0ZJP1_9ACTN|nr:twin-arginine translocase TatA/TatE family subunit [Nocardioides sp.]
MFGLTFEKLLLVAIISGVVIGPQRLPVYAQHLGETIRALRRLVETSRAQAEQEMGLALDRETLAALDLRQYDPRRIVREALREPVPQPADAAAESDAAVLAEAARVRPGQKYLVTGSAAHPRRIPIASLPEHDPRRIAARSAAAPDPSGAPEGGTAHQAEDRPDDERNAERYLNDGGHLVGEGRLDADDRLEPARGACPE